MHAPALERAGQPTRRRTAPIVISRRVQERHLGYLQAQKQRLTGELERELIDLATTSPLRDAPDEASVEEWLLDAYRRRWQL